MNFNHGQNGLVDFFVRNLNRKGLNCKCQGMMLFCSFQKLMWWRSKELLCRVYSWQLLWEALWAGFLLAAPREPGSTGTSVNTPSLGTTAWGVAGSACRTWHASLPEPPQSCFTVIQDHLASWGERASDLSFVEDLLSLTPLHCIVNLAIQATTRTLAGGPSTPPHLGVEPGL